MQLAISQLTGKLKSCEVTSSHKQHRDDFLALIMFDQLLFVFPFLLRNSSNLKPELLIMTQAEHELN